MGDLFTRHPYQMDVLYRGGEVRLFTCEVKKRRRKRRRRRRRRRRQKKKRNQAGILITIFRAKAANSASAVYNFSNMFESISRVF